MYFFNTRKYLLKILSKLTGSGSAWFTGNRLNDAENEGLRDLILKSEIHP
jgi:hypothetical protein